MNVAVFCMIASDAGRDNNTRSAASSDDSKTCSGIEDTLLPPTCVVRLSYPARQRASKTCIGAETAVGSTSVGLGSSGDADTGVLGRSRRLRGTAWEWESESEEVRVRAVSGVKRRCVARSASLATDVKDCRPTMAARMEVKREVYSAAADGVSVWKALVVSVNGATVAEVNALSEDASSSSLDAVVELMGVKVNVCVAGVYVRV